MEIPIEVGIISFNIMGMIIFIAEYFAVGIMFIVMSYMMLFYI